MSSNPVIHIVTNNILPNLSEFNKGPQGPTGPRFIGLPIVDTENRVYTTQTMYNTILSTPQDINTSANFKVNTISLGQVNTVPVPVGDITSLIQAGLSSFEQSGPQTGVLVYANQYDAKNDFVSKSEILTSSFANQFQNTFLTEPGTTFTGNCGSIKISDTKFVLNTIVSRSHCDTNFIHNGIFIDQGSFYTPNPSPFIGGIPNIAGLQVSALGVNIPVQNAYGAMIRRPLTGTNCNMGVFTDSLSLGSNNITVRPPLNGMLIQGDIVSQENVNIGRTGTSVSAYVTDKLVASMISVSTGTNMPVNCNGLNIFTKGITYGVSTNSRFISYIEGEFQAQVSIKLVTTTIPFSFQIEGDPDAGAASNNGLIAAFIVLGVLTGNSEAIATGAAMAVRGYNSETSNTYFYSMNLNPGANSLPIVWFRTVGDAKDNQEEPGVIHYFPHPEYQALYDCPTPAPTNIRCRYIRYGGKVTLHLAPFSYTSVRNPYIYGQQSFFNEGLDYYVVIDNLPSSILPKSGSIKTNIVMSHRHDGTKVNYYHVNDLFSNDDLTPETRIYQNIGTVIISPTGIRIYANPNMDKFKRDSKSQWTSTIISYTIDSAIPYT